MMIDKYFHLYGRKDDVVFEEIPKPEERPHGKWIEREDTKSYQFYECPVCNTPSAWRFGFCPVCGADMREEGGRNA